MVQPGSDGSRRPRVAVAAAVLIVGLLISWQPEINVEGSIALGAAASLFLLLVLVSAQFRRLTQSEASLAESKRLLAEKSALLEMTFERMDQGIMMVSADRIVEVCNRRAMALLDLPPELMERRPSFDEVMQYQWNSGEFMSSAASAEAFAKRGGILNVPLVYERRRANGRVIEVRSVVLDGGGVVRTYTDITDRANAQEQIRFAAEHDALTGLANRAFFRERLTRALAEADDGGPGVAVLFLDLDRFKLVNDTAGHETGDKLLVQVAKRLRAALRQEDVAARLGGDEFAVLQIGGDGPGTAAMLGRRLVESIAQPYDIEGKRVVIGVSVGVALHPADGDTPDVLMGRADTAMYRAKQSGRSTVRFFEVAMDLRQRERMEIDSDLREAMALGQIHLDYQPICDAVSGGVLGFEALLRWNHPTRGTIGPAYFVPHAEELGLIVPLGLWVLETACSTIARWTAMPGFAGLRMAVNISPLQFRQPDLPAEIAEILRRTGAAGHQLELEVTEGFLIDESRDVLDTMQHLKQLGIRLILDDFGTGHSGLSTLRRFPFDKIKIDLSFIQSMVTDETGRHADFGTGSRFKPAGKHAPIRHPVTLESGSGSRWNPAPLPKAFGHSPQLGLC